MIIEKWTGPPVDTHTYLLVDEPTRAAWVVDAPLETAAGVLQHVRERELRLERVILTHGHFDHILDVERYREAGIPIAICPREAPMLQAPQTALFGLPYAMPVFDPDEELAEGGTLRLADQEFAIWEVPGHSPGHVILYDRSQDLVVGGDLLFQGGYGRVDLPGADPAKMAASLRRLLTLPDRTLVLPGHGPETTIGAEREWLARMLSDPRGVRL
ncbi:MAG: beta-lactamase domain protein [Armatimonadetes bacterium]|nr:beta-lactamase domain protein [Armatimonadota bacterium]